jgi:hypothetical protein
MTLKEYYELLDTADWFYMMSDDHSVYKKGRDEIYRLHEMTDCLPCCYEDLFNRFQKWAHSVINGDKAEKPEKPQN